MSSPRNNGLDTAVAVVGMGCRFPGSPNLPAFWRTVRDSRVWSGPIPRSRWNHELFYSEKSGARDHNKTYVNRLCLVEDPGHFAPDAFGISPRRARIMDPQQRLFLDVVRGALEDAGYARRPLARDRVGTYVGATVSDFMDLVTVRMRATLLAGGEFGQGLAPVDAYKAMTQDLVPLQAYTVVGSLLNMAAANVNQCFDFGGPAFTTDAACSSALVALHEAVLHLRNGICDTAIVGGVYMVLSPDNVLGFARIGAVSMANVCRPFDQRADGFVVGEGVGAVVLKRLPEALASNDHIYAVIRGVGINNDGKGEGPMTPRKEGQIAVLDRAYSDAGLDPRTIDLVEAHGTATPVGDATEVAALTEFRGRGIADGKLCALSSVKANVGHSMSAAGIAGFIRAALSVDRKVITPHAAYEQPRPELGLAEGGFFVPQTPQAWGAPTAHPRRAGVNSFGFGGTNVHVVLEEAPAVSTGARARVSVAAPRELDATHSEVTPQPHLFVLSAPTAPLLQKHAADLHQALLDDERIEPETLSYSLSLRKAAAARVAFVADARDKVLAHLAAIAEGRAQASASDVEPSSDRFFGEAPAEAPQVAFLFPGQGAQVPELARDLYDRFPSFRRTLDDLTADVAVSGRPLLSYLYPRNGARERAMQELTRTEVCQPIMAAIGLAVAKLLRDLGVRPVAVTGHSLGEFAAAADAGVIDGKAAVDLVAARGRIIASLPLVDPGTMAAVAADAATTTAALADLPDVGVANVNHPRQTVISGTQQAVPVAMARMEQQGIKTRRLNVSHAFHSPLMAGLREPFVKHLEAVAIGSASTAVISGVAEGAYPLEASAVRELWAAHATLPVDFVAATRAVAQAGARVLVQVGGGSALVNMARATLAGSETRTVAATGETPDDTRTLLLALAQLYVAGLDLQLDALFEGRALSPTTLPASVLETRHLWPVKKEEVHPRLRVATTHPAEPLLMSQQNPKDASVAPAPSSLAGNDSEPRTSPELAALFRQQMALLDTHAAIIRQQNELLLRGSSAASAAAQTFVPAVDGHAAPAGLSAQAVAAPASPAVADVQPPVPAEPPAPEAAADVEAAVIAAAARITASPASSLSASTRLGADLGFDSLMVVELSTALAETYPGLELPRSVFAGDVSIAQLARHVLQLRGQSASQRAAAIDPASAGVGRHAVVWRHAPVSAPGSAPLDDAPVFIIAPPAFEALAQSLAQRLRDAGRDADIVGSLPAGKQVEACHVVDLRPLAADPSDLVAPVLTALADAQLLDGARPASWRLVRTGLATAALDGFAKALHQEWEQATVGVVIVDDERLSTSAAQVAEGLAAELLAGSACPEVRLASGTDGSIVRQIADTQAVPAALARPAQGLVVLISGGAQGLGAKLARTLVADVGAKVALLGRRPANDASVAALLADLRSLGGSVFYAACDVRDAQAVAAAVQAATRALGPIEAVVHAAAVAADGPVAARSHADAQAVLATKLDGARNLWTACAQAPLRAFVALGSLAGRYGNAHQCDYAAANGALPALLASFQSARPMVRTTVLHLPPWAGGGLIERLPDAARKALAARVRFLRDDEGLPLLLDALAPAGASGDFVVAGTPPTLPQGFAWVRGISVEDPGYLTDHVIASRPVLPLAGAVDWMVQAAQAAGRTLPVSLTHLTVVDGIVLERQNATLRLGLTVDAPQAGPAEAAKLSLARIDGRVRVGFRAGLSASNAKTSPLAAPAALQAARMSLGSYYQEHTFHGPGLHAITNVHGLSADAIVGDIKALPVDGGTTVVASLDGVLQLFGFWSSERHGRGGLPLGIKDLVLHRVPGEGEPLRVVAHARAEEDGRLRGDADVIDARGALVMSLRGFEAEPREHGHVSPDKRNGKAAHAAHGNGNGKVAHGNGSNGHGSNGNGHGHSNGHARAEAPAVPTAHFRIDEFPEVKDLQQRMSMAKAMGIAIPYFRSHEGINAATATINGQTLINFSSYNYLGFSGHPEVTRAAKEALDRYGSSVSASRIASGERPLHTDLEKALAKVIGTEDAIVMVGGHATNVSVLGHLLGPEDLVVHDSLAHDSIVGGVKLSGARRRPFPHNDVDALERILRDSRGGVRRVLIAVEGVYSMDGDIAPLDRIIEIKRKYGALLLVDEAHSIGVLGAGGRGVGEHFDVNRSDVDLWMGTLSKSFASCGGYIAGTRALVQYLRYTVPGFVYSVGISPPNAASALAAIRLMEQHPELVTGLREKSRLFLSLCRERGLDTGPSEGSAVIPCVVGNSYICLQLSQALLARGINVQPILYPAVEENQARLRFFISVTHTEEQLRTTADVVAEELYRLKPDAAKPLPGADVQPQSAQTQP